MITLFHVTGAMIYVDPDGQQTGYDDVFTKIECAARTTRRSAWAATSSTSSSADGVTRRVAAAEPR